MRLRPSPLSTYSVALTLAFATTCLVLSCGGSGSSSLPADARPDCVFSSADFAALFVSGTVTLDGSVKPANGFSFGSPLAHNCSFYQWAEQMFLWVTSPAPVSYGGGGGRVFASPVFFDVTPPDASNHRTLVRHTPGGLINLGVRDVKAGVHGLRILTSTNGQLWEVALPVLSRKGRQLILNGRGDTL